MSIFEAVGGEPAVQKAVALCFGRMIEDPEVGSFFEGVDMIALQKHVRAYVSALMGGPDNYSGRSLAEAHASLGISDTDFDAFLAHMVDTLIALGAPDDTISRVGGLFAFLRPQIVSSKPGHQHVPRTVKVLRGDNHV